VIDYSIMECGEDLKPVSEITRTTSIVEAHAIAERASREPSEYYDGKATVSIVLPDRVVATYIGGEAGMTVPLSPGSAATLNDADRALLRLIVQKWNEGVWYVAPYNRAVRARIVRLVSAGLITQREAADWDAKRPDHYRPASSAHWEDKP